MEPHSSLRLFLVFLCLVGRARSRLGPDISPSPEPASRLVPDISPSPEPAAFRLVPDITPSPEPAASRLVPDISPSLEPAASRLVPDVSPTPEPAAPRLSPDVSPTPASQLSPEPSASASPFPSQDIPYEAAGLFALPNSPAESDIVDEAAELVAEELDVPSVNEHPGSVNEAATLVAALDAPSAKELVDGADITAALDSLDENTLKTLPFTSSS